MKKLIVLLIALVSSCGRVATDDVEQDGKEVIVVTSYKVEGSLYLHNVEKFVIEGHDYLVFSSKIAYPPTIVHSESCPCKNKEEGK